MNHPITICETTQKNTLCPSPLISSQIEITNISDQFINNVKLTIHDVPFTICEEAVIRERGALSFDPDTQCLELGNLAPHESAYFEYKFFAPCSHVSLSDHFFISYTADPDLSIKEKKVADYLT